MSAIEINSPPGWTHAPLEDFCEIVQGQSPPGETYNTNGQGLPFFQGKAEFGDLYPTPVKWCSSPSKVAEKEDVLISVRAPVGPTNLCPTRACIGRGLAAIRPLGGVGARYVLYGLRHTQDKLVALSTGSTFGAISGDTLRSHQLPVAPLSEQRRIVEEIEKQFTRLEAGVTALKRVQANLKRCRAAVLRAAVEGRLVPTEAELARREGRSYEPASELLKRILAERRARWEAGQMAKFYALGKLPKDEKWKRTYREPAVPDPGGLGDTPEGWVWVSVGQLAWSVKDGPHFSPRYVAQGVPFITGGQVRPSGVDFGGAKRITEELHAQLSQRCEPERGDILYTKGGTTGIARVNTYDFPFSVWVHVAVLKLVRSVEPFFVQHALNSPSCYTQAQRFTHGVGNQDLGLTRMVKITFGLPPTVEQKRIAAEVDRRLSIVDELEIEVEANLKRAERLRQAILKRAFEGKLVPQDPNDEPASVLLDRICAQRVSSQGQGGLTRSKNAVATVRKPTGGSTRNR